MIDKMNYNSATDRGKLVTAVEPAVVPWLPVGERNGEVYRILPGVYGLHPDQPRPKTNRELISGHWREHQCPTQQTCSNPQGKPPRNEY